MQIAYDFDGIPRKYNPEPGQSYSHPKIIHQNICGLTINKVSHYNILYLPLF